jgi:REP element-mobilizing transposase RayT
MVLNEFGKIVEGEWLKTKEIRHHIDLDYYVIMPNHIHGVVIINSRGELNSPQDVREGRIRYAPTNDKFKSPSQSLGAIIRGFKSAVTKRIREFTGNLELKIWQRNYYEHIIRNDVDLYNIRKYIELNPLKWELDEYYLLGSIK